MEHKDLNTEKTANSDLADVSVSLSVNVRYKIFIDKMISEIKDLAEMTFNSEQDPEVQWKFFREQLTHYKRSQILKWLDTDDA